MNFNRDGTQFEYRKERISGKQKNISTLINSINNSKKTMKNKNRVRHTESATTKINNMLKTKQFLNGFNTNKKPNLQSEKGYHKALDELEYHLDDQLRELREILGTMREEIHLGLAGLGTIGSGRVWNP